MKLATLQNISTTILADTFNLAFSDYVLPFVLSAEQLELKLFSDLVDLHLSVGVYEKDQLVAFMLTGVKQVGDATWYYNAGTGVIPSNRSTGLVDKMYDYLSGVLGSNTSKVLVLEVIKGNEKAIKAYNRQGYTIARTLNCFKGVPTTKEKQVQELRFEIANDLNQNQMQAFWDIEPSWQNSNTALQQLQKHTSTVIAIQNDAIVGYAVYNSVTCRLYQLAVSKSCRRQGIGSQLMQSVYAAIKKPFAITNIDDCDAGIKAFLADVGLEHYVTQFEMTK